MVIAPIKAGALEPVIEEALAQATQASERLKPYSELSDDQKTATQQLCYFLAFGICEEINDRVGHEIETILSLLKELKEVAVGEPVISRIEVAFLNLRQLKGGGLVPGERITSHDASKYIYKNAKAFCKRAPSEVFTVTEWDVDYESIHIENDRVKGRFPLSELIFILDK
tara:strand:- start:4177 stop:4686 length:510 start_codon:yes stop_codon:yes gene_type:complete